MSRVAIIGENSITYIELLLDVWNSGDCAVLVDWRIPFPTALQMMIDANVEKCYIEENIFHQIKEFNSSHIIFSVYKKCDCLTALLPPEIYTKYHENYSKEEAIVIYSSGTTGKAKGVILSHYAITTNADAIISYMNLNESDCMYMVKTISHLSSITGELLVSLKVKNQLLISPVIVPPRFILHNIQRYNVSKICLNPTLLELIVKEYQRRTYNISSLGDIFIQGAKTNDVLGKKARTIFNKCNIYFEYGLTEAGPRVASQKVNEVCNSSVGKPILGVKVVAISEQGSTAKANEKGIIHVKTPSVFSGYIQGSKRLPSLYNGWLNTGDIGFLDDVGDLHIVGRADDVLNICAHKIYPYDVEKQIQKFADVQECVVTAVQFHNEEMLCCLYVSDVEIHKDIKKILGSVLIRYEIPKAFFRINAIPKKTSGKIAMKKVKEIILQNLQKA